MVAFSTIEHLVSALCVFIACQLLSTHMFTFVIALQLIDSSKTRLITDNKHKLLNSAEYQYALSM